MSTEKDEDIEYQIGANDIDKKTSLGDESELIEFNYESAAIFKRIADDIYKSKEAGIREPLQNGITAVKRAINSGYIDKNDGVIKIEVTDGEKVHLNLIDNGIGISKNVLKNVLSVIGRSQNRDQGNLSGKYGMGFLACYKLVGTDGGFIMHTNSRETDNDPIKGIWKPSCFEMDNGNKLPDRLDNDEYGTRFEFKVNASLENIRRWVKKHSKWATIPIIYEEYDKNGEIVYDEEYGMKSLKDEAQMSVCVENEYFNVVCSPNAEERSILLNSPINTDRNLYIRSIGWKYDIRFKNENGVIAKGPNKGLQPVKKSEYKGMSDSRKKEYIPNEDLSSEDISLPQPTGTRDNLESNIEFWDYVEQEITEKYNSKVQKICENVDDIKSYKRLSEGNQILLNHIIKSKNLVQDTNKKTKKNFKNEFNVDVTDKFINIIRTSQEKVWFVQRGADATKASRKTSSVTDRIEAIKCDKKSSDDGSVYMAVSLNQDKMDAIWEDNNDNIIVRIPSSDLYDEFEKHFGWSRLRYITKNISKLDISKKTKEKLKNDKKGTNASTNKTKNSNRELEKRNLTVHSQTTNTGFTVEEIQERYEKRDEYLVLFPSNEERNLSDHKFLTSEHVSIANCIVKVYDYLKDIDNIYSISEWIDKFKDKKLDTSNGKLSVNKLKDLDKEVLFHIVDRSVVDAFRDDTVMEEMKTVVNENNNHCSYRTEIDSIDMDNMIYIPVTLRDLNEIRIYFGSNNSSIFTLCNSVRDQYIGTVCNQVSKTNVYWYAWARLPRWRNTKEIECLDENDKQTLNPDWIWLIDNIANSNYELKSISGMNILPPETYIEYQTSHGTYNIKEILSKFDSVVLHITEPKTVDAFRQDSVINNTLEYIMENAKKHRSGDYITDNEFVNENNTVYIPMIESQYNTLLNVIEQPDGDHLYTLPNSEKSAYICALTGEKYSSSIDSSHQYNINSDTAAYISARLGRDISDIAIPYDNHDELSSLSEGGLELIETINTCDKL